ncbi:mediator of RNA polymerase II transcription subunit 17 [Cornus florida]|uniref:mediator of RNA polymerase II transcription subunit 17 n=1 Tax=Cornus florida TaxID=4283 RepID=UPI00289E6DB2|nr:mediator of RNA polymerase II transcription subunit 17 [Cornus florida]XP_059637992.1 mediator of RNA polymerase II transcription subunit 17 [Cornus florida]XP_059637993.1 mediator of RNA polymerase II transcription subunit 17 [Cornus florida]
MDGSLEISLDKLPIKRLEAIEEHGLERFPSDVGYEEKRVNLIRRIDFAWAVERADPSKKQKKSSSSKETTKPWPWQSMVENLQLAHQELSVIIDLINTVETNDAVTVAGMTRPKQLPNEHLSDLAVSTATKLQCFRHLGKYFKQSAKALEQQVAREARFYGALIRLQQNWKVKRQRVVSSAPGNEGFYIDLFDNTLYDPVAIFRPSSVSTVHVEHDPAGMLAINLPPNSSRSLQFGFLSAHIESSKRNTDCSLEDPSRETKSEPVSDDECVKETHSVLRKVHRTIFEEQVFDLVNREAFNISFGVNVTGIRENYLQLSIGQGDTVFISLVPSGQDNQTVDNASSQNLETALITFETSDGSKLADGKYVNLEKNLGFPSRISFEIYLQQIFHEHVFVRAKDRSVSSGRAQLSGQPAKNEQNLLGHFCMSLAHRIFSNKVLSELETLVSRVPYVHLISHPTWHSRTSSWTLSMNVPQSILHAGHHTQRSDIYHVKDVKSHFRTKVVVNDDCINVEGEGAPNVVGLFKGKCENICSMNRYDCDLADLPMILLQQIASQVVRWLHEEALLVGMKGNRDFLCLSFELEQGETLGLVAHVDPEDTQGCISWWLVMDDGFTGEHRLHTDVSSGVSESRKFLGYLSLDVLYSTLMDLVSLCSGVGSH